MDLSRLRSDSATGQAETDGERAENQSATDPSSVSLSRRDTLASVAGLGGLGLPSVEIPDSVFEQPATEASPAPTWQQVTKLLPDDTDAFDTNGASIAIDGDTAVVGVYGNANETGAVYVFRRTNEQWQQDGVLVGNDLQANDRFGSSVAVAGSTIVVGAPGGDELARNAGAAYVFSHRDGGWTQEAKLLADEGHESDYFGRSVALNESRIVVAGRGSGYAFHRDEGQWRQEAALVAQDAPAYEEFASVAISATTAIVGTAVSEYGDFTGSVYVFTLQDGEWAQQAELCALDDRPADRFGRSVALDGDTALVGAQGSRQGQTGAVYAFRRQNGEWNQEAKLTAEDPEGGDSFGLSVSLDGDTAIICARDDDVIGERSASAYIFERRNGQWQQEAKILPDEGEQWDWVVVDADVSGDTAVVWTQEEDEYGVPSPGSAYVYRRTVPSPPAPESTVDCGDTIHCHLGDDGDSGTDATGFRGPEYFHDVFGFTGSQGQGVYVRMVLDESADADVDPYLVLLDPSGEVLESDEGQGTDRPAGIAKELPADGEYTVVATSSGPNQQFPYTLSLSCAFVIRSVVDTDNLFGVLNYLP